MLIKFFVFVLGIILLSGCAAMGQNHALELQQCQRRISFLEAELKDKEREIADLEYDVQREESESYGRLAAPVKIKSESNYPSIPTTTQIQKALKNAGYYKGPIDGKMGAKTQDAIVKFQEDNELKADGKVGKMTWSELKRYLE